MPRTTEKQEPDQPHRAIWCAVVLQALADADSTDASDVGRKRRREAIRWLTRPSADFDEVCALAGLDPQATRERSIEAFGRDVDAEPRRRAYRNRVLTHKGLTLSITEWARRKSVAYCTISSRLGRGWSVADTLETPFKQDKRRPSTPGGGSNTSTIA